MDKQKIVEALEKAADALAYAAFNIDGSKLENLHPRLVESTSVSETALISERDVRTALASLTAEAAEAKATLSDDEIRNIAVEAGAYVRQIEQFHGVEKDYIFSAEKLSRFDRAIEARALLQAGQVADHTEDNLTMVNHSGEANEMVKTDDIPKWNERGYDDEHSDVAMMAEIADLRTAIVTLSQSAEKPAVPDWISVKDRLPTHIYSVLGYVIDGPLTSNGIDPMIDIVSYCPKIKAWLQYFDEEDVQVNVTHWMDLPDAPNIAACAAKEKANG